MKKLAFFIALITYCLVSLIEIERQQASFQSNFYIHFLGSVPNFVAIIAYTAVSLFIAKTTQQYYKYLIGFSLGVISYEILQIWLDWRIFDWADILYSVLGFIFVYLGSRELENRGLLSYELDCVQTVTKDQD